MMNARIIPFAFIFVLVTFFSSCNQPPSEKDIPLELSEGALMTATVPVISTVFPTEEIIQGTISLRHAWDETEAPTLASIIKIFQSYYPDVLFDVLSVPADTLLDYYISESSAGTGATILLGPVEWGLTLQEKGLVDDLSGAFDPEILAGLNQPALKAGYINGKLFSLPYAVSGVVLFRNAELITLQPNTFDELVTLAQTSTHGNIIGAYLERSFFYSGAHLFGLGGQLIDSNNLPGFNNGAGVEWLQLLRDFELAGPVSYFSDDDLERFKLSQVGWIIDGTWNMQSLIDAIGIENLAVDPWPKAGSGSMSGFVQSENIFLSSKTDSEERSAALRFIQFLIAPEAQTRLTDIGRLPANPHVFIIDKAFQVLINQTSEALEGGCAYPIGSEIEMYSLNLDIALRAYFDENREPDQLLQSAQDSILVEKEKSASTAVP